MQCEAKRKPVGGRYIRVLVLVLVLVTMMMIMSFGEYRDAMADLPLILSASVALFRSVCACNTA